MAAVAIERHVQRAEILRLASAPASRARVIGREHAAHEADDGEAMAAIVAQAVEIPPTVAALRDRSIEARNASRLSAARRPESIAIGTPGPGCTLPPAR